ncbi:uncharacterized protein HMPREF1541_00904 [Cyphellophora europaea CBS 101466]|uniref:DUF7704 domain-containing protein n=1 Tax=Cyphellophora europaea (strain CBS 101466) TaxID=1220924 RepID=W2SDL3_CYPE1|nr:uncharacterized protein HMPREF1541_00904 [Cyphellophora europaea CBS 101466]ETN46715.1 hypothetical protein HMPREF1541_00904 [Cyphellophora europaea CBS 101466]
MAPSTSTNNPIHPLYAIIFTYIEPFLALGGVIQTLSFPFSYIAISHPTIHTALSPHPHLHPQLQTLFTCIAGGWSILTFNDIVTLRVFSRDPKVWRCVLAAHLCSDLLYVLALAQDVGYAHALDPRLWSRKEWFTNVLTLPFMWAKMAFLVGVGVDSDARERVVAKEQLRGKKA